MTEPAVVIERQDAVAILRLSRPDTRNALDGEVKAALELHVPALIDDPAVRCLVITGSGRAFCAGGDIRSLAVTMTPAETRQRMARSYGWIERLSEGEKPVVTAVNGAAVGAGFGLAMLGDIILAADDAWFMAGFGVIGAAADYGLARTLPRAIGMPRAKDLLLSGRRVNADEAATIGMVSRLVPTDRLQTEALALAQALAAAPTVGLGLTKMLMQRGQDGSTASFLQQEGFAQATAFATADHAEGVRAFLDKRPPLFEGR